MGKIGPNLPKCSNICSNILNPDLEREGNSVNCIAYFLINLGLTCQNKDFFFEKQAPPLHISIFIGKIKEIPRIDSKEPLLNRERANEWKTWIYPKSWVQKVKRLDNYKGVVLCSNNVNLNLEREGNTVNFIA